MLEFSDAPYQFFPPNPSRPLIWLGRKANQHFILQGKGHRVSELVVQGETEALREERVKGIRHLFVFNHPSHSDPQTVTEVHRRLGIPSSFMAAYDVFLRNGLNRFLMPRLGHFSIDREGSDRKAMSAAIEILKQGDFALNIFPEGNVYLTNDRVTPFLDGTAFIAAKAQKASPDEEVRIVPVSLKFTNLSDIRPVLIERRNAIAELTGFTIDPDQPTVSNVIELGMHLLGIYLKEHGIDPDSHPTDREGFRAALRNVAERLITELEEALEITPAENQDYIDRIRKIRSHIHQIRTDESSAEDRAAVMRQLADKAILAFRILSYLTPYLTEKPNLDRLAETAERLGEDYYSKILPVPGPKRGIVTIHDSISVAKVLEEAGGKMRDAVTSLTPRMEQVIQKGIDAINESNDSPGAEMVKNAG